MALTACSRRRFSSLVNGEGFLGVDYAFPIRATPGRTVSMAPLSRARPAVACALAILRNPLVGVRLVKDVARMTADLTCADPKCNVRSTGVLARSDRFEVGRVYATFYHAQMVDEEAVTYRPVGHLV